MKLLQCYQFRLIIFFSLFLSPALLIAAENSPQGSSAESVEVTKDEIDSLIVTLESTTARQQFIENLKTLAAVGAEEDRGMSFSFSQLIEIDEASGTLVGNYVKFVRNLGFSETSFSKAVLSVLVLVVAVILTAANNKIANILDKSLDSARKRFHWDVDRFRTVFWGQRLAGYIIVSFLSLYTLASIVTSPENSLVFLSWGSNLARFTALTLLLTFFVLVAWEVTNALFEYYTRKSSRLSDTRVQTLIPVARNIMFFTIMVIAGMVVISELGVDLVPLLAGAGVVGVAIGFGAQTMIKDFLNGFIIVLEDLMQVGDVVTLAGNTGRVEKITLRKVQLRALNGTVSTIPHSEISVIENWTKEYSYYLLEVGVAYKEDTDRVIELLRKIGEELRECSEYGDLVLDELEVLGVDRFEDSAVVIKARIKTSAHDKWKVGREFNRRLKYLFDKEGVEIPFPHRTLYFGNQLEQQVSGANLDEQATTNQEEPGNYTSENKAA